MSRLRELILAAALVACTKDEPSRATTTAPAPLGLDASADAAVDAGVTGAADDTPRIPPPLLASPRRAKSVGHTSVVFKVELASGTKAAFRPGYAKGPIRYKGEIAAFRLGRALGLTANLPPAFPRTMSAKELAGAIGEPLSADVIYAGDAVKGAIVPWIEDLTFLPLEREPLATKWRAWMKRGARIEDESGAPQIAAMVVFDWVTGNWDRLSGGNVGYHGPSRAVLFIDNDGAFFETPPQEHLARQWKMLEAMDRFPRGLVGKLRALDAPALARVIGEEAPGVPLLSDKALAGVDERRQKLLALVDAKAADGGDAETFFFP